MGTSWVCFLLRQKGVFGCNWLLDSRLCSFSDFGKMGSLLGSFLGLGKGVFGCNSLLDKSLDSFRHFSDWV